VKYELGDCSRLYGSLSRTRKGFPVDTSCKIVKRGIMTKRGRPPKITDRHRRVARGYIREGKTAKQALLESGYSLSTAKKGLRELEKTSPAFKMALAEEIRDYLESLTGGIPTADARKAVALTTLTKNAILGEQDRKGSTYAANLLGKCKDVGIFEPEAQVGIMNLQVPEQWKDRYSLPSEKIPPASGDSERNDSE